MTSLRIAGGHVVDPAHGVDGVADVWIVDGKVVAAPSDPEAKADRTIDARGFVVMAAGVDIHCHIAGPKVNAARKLRPEDAAGDAPTPRRAGMRSGGGGVVPSSFTTGARYAGLGYGTAVDAAIAPLGARATHHEFRDTPIIDKAFLVLMGNHHYVLERVRDGDADRLRAFVAWMLGATRALGVKVVNPGGIERWKQGHGTTSNLDDRVEHFDVTPREILLALARATDDLGLPHPIHVHGLNLGLPGNSRTTLETMEALDGHRAHLAHIQFHSYGGSPDKLGGFDSQVAPLAAYLETHKNLSVDVGQVMFGPTVSMTADAAVGQYLHQVTGGKWYSHDTELETGCGVVPITYEDKNAVHALQWAIGLEWYLRVSDPWQVAMSTDHPNGGSFQAYPEIIALLMDRGHRADTLQHLPERVRARSGLADLPREYTLSEIAIITRAGPARQLGLRHKGHLGPGADGDVTIYSPDADRRRMFQLPRYLIKGGVVVLDDGDLRHAPGGHTLHAAPDQDPDAEPDILDFLLRRSTISPGHFAVRDHELTDPVAVPCGEGDS